MMIEKIYEDVFYFLQLTFKPEVLWNVVPLAIATILIVIYFQRYKNENPGWNSYLTNSLVLLFVSLALLRHIYSIDGEGALNFITYQAKSIASIFLLLVGTLILRFNFEHLLPERIAKYLSSPLLVNLGAYAVILFVYSEKNIYWEEAIALIVIVLLLALIVNISKIPLSRLFVYVEKEKEKEVVKNIKESKYQIKELKNKAKEIEKDLKYNKLKELDKQKKKAIKLKKIIKK